MNKIIIFSKHFWPDNFKINIMAKELVKKGYEVSVITSTPNYNYKRSNSFKNNFFINKRKWNGINIYYLPVFRKKNFNWLSIFLNYVSHFIACFFYCHFFIRKKYDLVFVFGTSPIFQSLPAIYFSFLISKPIILWVQDLWPESLKDTGYIKNKYILSFIKYFVKINYSLSDLILVQSDKFKKKIKKDFKITNKIITHYNPSEVKFQKFQIPKNNKITITYSGNFGKAQDFETLLKCLEFQKIKKYFYFNLIGSGKKFNYLKNYINEKKLNNYVKIKNYTKDKNLYKILLNSDALFMTLNKGDALDNTIPGKFQTYISFGKPIISNSNGVSRSIIAKSKIGFINFPGDYKNLYKNLLKLKNISYNAKKNIYKKSNLLYMKYFELSKNMNDLDKIFKRYMIKKDV